MYASKSGCSLAINVKIFYEENFWSHGMVSRMVVYGIETNKVVKDRSVLRSLWSNGYLHIIKALKCKPSAPYASVVSMKQICFMYSHYSYTPLRNYWAGAAHAIVVRDCLCSPMLMLITWSWLLGARAWAMGICIGARLAWDDYWITRVTLSLITPTLIPTQIHGHIKY